MSTYKLQLWECQAAPVLDILEKVPHKLYWIIIPALDYALRDQVIATIKGGKGNLTTKALLSPSQGDSIVIDLTINSLSGKELVLTYIGDISKKLLEVEKLNKPVVEFELEEDHGVKLSKKNKDGSTLKSET